MSDGTVPIRPTIRVDLNEARVVREARTALAAGPTFYERFGVLGTIDPNRGEPKFVPAKTETIRHHLSDQIRWVKAVDDGDRDITPPRYAAPTLASLPDLTDYRSLKGLATVPILRRDGSIASANGFDRSSGWFLQIPKGFDVPFVEQPSDRDIADALELLFDFLKDFPFAEPYHQSAAIAYLLTLVGRTAFQGPSPLFFVSGTTPGSGKGLLIDRLTNIMTGRDTKKQSVAKKPSDEELRKEILTMLIEGHRAVMWDNADSGGRFGSPVIDSLITASEMSGRLLGFNRSITAPNETAWSVTGNGITISGDLGRRVLPILLAPKEQNPEERDLRDLEEYIESSRSHLLGAAITLIRGWFVAGCPDTAKKIGSFTGWSKIRRVIAWAGLPDPYQATIEFRRANDFASDEMMVIHDGFRAAFGRTAVTSNDIIYRSTHMAETDQGNDFLHEVAARCREGTGTNERLGRYLQRYVGRWFEDARIVKDQNAKPRRWRLESRKV